MVIESTVVPSTGRSRDPRQRRAAPKCPQSNRWGWCRATLRRYLRRIFCRGYSIQTSRERALANWERNSGLNLVHLFEPSPRIGFRCQSGTLDSTKARHWMRLVNRLVEHALIRNCQASNRRVAPTPAEFDDWLMAIGLRSHSDIYRKISPEPRVPSQPNRAGNTGGSA